ncbi:MAG: GNAT family N-acetyltransferase [Caldilineaceae bacterium]|nr:GNAT family N-acetyltransferase [Caldilineaceae bacterium]
MAESSLAAEPRQIAFDAQNAEHVRWTVAVWNQAANSSIPLTERFLKYSFTEDAGVVRAGRIAFVQDRPAGFVLCSVHPGAPPAMRTEVTGWIEAIAVAPTYQRKGIGRRLLDWAQNWLDSQENPSASGLVKVGGGPRHFVPGVQAGSDAELFFLACGFDYEDEPFTWDVARSLSDYSRPVLDHVPAAARPGQPGQEGDVLGFLASEFPGRWHWQAERFLEEGGRISDFMLLWTEEGVQGSCRLTFEDSVNPIDRYFPYQLPRPWGQLGWIGISAHLRGQGLGIFLLDAGLRRLHNSGVNGCVIDWTTLLDFYAKCGFLPHRKWAKLYRTRGSNG